MARRISPSRGSSISGGGFRATRISSGGFKSTRSSSGGFKPRTSYFYGGYNRHYRPYRRNYFFYSLGPVGKIVYVGFVIILIFILSII